MRAAHHRNNARVHKFISHSLFACIYENVADQQISNATINIICRKANFFRHSNASTFSFYYHLCFEMNGISGFHPRCVCFNSLWNSFFAGINNTSMMPTSAPELLLFLPTPYFPRVEKKKRKIFYVIPCKHLSFTAHSIKCEIIDV